MKVRLGYVAISKKLGKKVTSSSTVTFANYNKLKTEEAKLEKLNKVLLSNVSDLEAILKYNIKNNIHFYRITSNLIPLATHSEVDYYNYFERFEKDFDYIGKLINESDMRVDAHPDHFNVINSTNLDVVETTKKNLIHQVEIFEKMHYSDKAKMVIHVGGATGGKEKGLERFIENFNTYPECIKEKLIIENDDKIYTAKEVLNLCEKLGIPMVLDIHHHNCNNEEGKEIGDIDIVGGAFNTWNNTNLPPKIHFSSPRDFVNDRKHSDYIVAPDFVDFIEKVKKYDRDFDVMLECKEKDLALYQLADDIKSIKPEYKWIDTSTFIV